MPFLRSRSNQRRRVPLLLFIAIGAMFTRVAHADNFFFGIDFVDVPTEAIGFPFLDDQNEVDNTYWPTPLTDPNSNAVQDGGFAGWSEAEARSAVVLAVEHAFRRVNTGDPETTLQIAFFNGTAPTSLEGRRLNTVVGHNEWSNQLLLGQALYSAYDDQNVPQDEYATMAQPPHIDQLSGIDIATAEAAINLFAGTIAHEIGHNFALDHVDRGDDQPFPLMATAPSGLTNADRLTERWFIPAHEADLTARIGTVNRADFDFDGDVDFTESPFGNEEGQSDLNILIANVGHPYPLMQHGDTDMDGDVDFSESPFGEGDGVSDLNFLVANVTTGASDLGADNADGTGGAELVYNGITGEIYFANADASINLLQLHVDPGLLTITNAANYFAVAPNVDDGQALQFFAASGLPTGEHPVGLISPGAALTQGQNVFFRYQRPGGTLQDGTITTIIPEPTSIALLGLGGLALLRRRRVRE